MLMSTSYRYNILPVFHTALTFVSIPWIVYSPYCTTRCQANDVKRPTGYGYNICPAVQPTAYIAPAFFLISYSNNSTIYLYAYNKIRSSSKQSCCRGQSFPNFRQLRNDFFLLSRFATVFFSSRLLHSSSNSLRVASIFA